MSANHHHDLGEAKRIIHAAKEAGADAIKLQTYTPDTLTIDCSAPPFMIKGTLWEGRKLHDLYGEAYTPWEWHAELKALAEELGIDLFSTPFDNSAVDFLEQQEVPVYKIASFENIHLPLIRYIASKGKPIVMSTGMATLAELDEAVRTIRSEGNNQIILLRCTSAYPAPAKEAHLRTIPHLAETFHVLSGLSDHTMGTAVPVAAVALGACMIEKHFTLSRDVPGPDSAFSLEPHEFKSMVDAVRTAEKALGSISYELTEKQKSSIHFRRSIFVVEDTAQGEALTEDKIRIIRPGYGLHPRHFNDIVGRRARTDISRGTPLDWDLIS